MSDLFSPLVIALNLPRTELCFFYVKCCHISVPAEIVRIANKGTRVTASPLGVL